MIYSFCNSISLSLAVSYKPGMRAALAAQSVSLERKIIIHCTRLESASSRILPYLLKAKSEAQFEVLQKRKNGFTPSSQF